MGLFFGENGEVWNQVVREQFRRFEETLRPALWDDYLEGCHERDPEMPAWSDSTRAKLRQNAIRMLAEVGYLEDTWGLRLKRLQIAPEMMGYLEENEESYVIRCIQASQ